MAAPRDVLLPRPPKGMGKGALLALLVHAGLIAAIALGVQWKASEPAGVEAELWASVPQVAAPQAPAPQVEPKPEPPPPPPKVEPRPEPKPETPDPQIALERERKEREKKLAEERERREEAEKLAKAKAERERQEREKREKAEREAREARETAKLAELREQQLKRMQELAGGTGAPTATGTATQTAGPSASYAGRIKARIKPNVVFTETVPGNPVASVEVRAAADGTIVGRRLVRSSGVPAWDDAVLRAVDKTEVLPRDVDGRVPATIIIDFRPRD